MGMDVCGLLFYGVVVESEDIHKLVDYDNRKETMEWPSYWEALEQWLEETNCKAEVMQLGHDDSGTYAIYLKFYNVEWSEVMEVTQETFEMQAKEIMPFMAWCQGCSIKHLHGI